MANNEMINYMKQNKTEKNYMEQRIISFHMGVDHGNNTRVINK